MGENRSIRYQFQHTSLGYRSFDGEQQYMDEYRTKDPCCWYVNLLSSPPSLDISPTNITTGHYIFRHEIIALHGATTANGAQNYPFCVNIDVTGSGTASPAGVAATSFYKATDPGILFNPYVTLSNYTIPGPALWTG